MSLKRVFSVALLLIPVLLLSSGCHMSFKSKTSPGSPNAAKIHIRYQHKKHGRNHAMVSFNVYRSKSPNGPFNKINQEPLKALENPADGQMQLVMTDYDVNLDDEYYYYLEGIGPKGQKTKLTGVTHAMATLPVMPEEKTPENKAKAKKKGPTKVR